jgi:hypothetical protein
MRHRFGNRQFRAEIPPERGPKTASGSSIASDQRAKWRDPVLVIGLK